MWPLMWPKRFIACDITINLLMLLTIMNYIIRYVAECLDQLCISELADHGIAGARPRRYAPRLATGSRLGVARQHGGLLSGVRRCAAGFLC